MGCGQSTQPHEDAGPLPDGQAEIEPFDASKEPSPALLSDDFDRPKHASNQHAQNGAPAEGQRSSLRDIGQPLDPSVHASSPKELGPTQLVEKERRLPNPFGESNWSQDSEQDWERSRLEMEDSLQSREFEPVSVDFSTLQTGQSSLPGHGPALRHEDFGSTQGSQESSVLSSMVHRPSMGEHGWVPAQPSNNRLMFETGNSMSESFGPNYDKLGRQSALPRAGSALSYSSSDEVMDRAALKKRSMMTVQQKEVEKSQEDEIDDILAEIGDLSIDELNV